MSTKNRSRRDFLRKLSCAICAGAGSALLPQMGLVGRALAAGTALPGYKALVCVYLDGGNDSYNLLMPRDATTPGSRYDTYLQSRGGIWSAGANPLGLGIDFSAMLPIAPANQAFAFGLHPQCADYNVARNGNTYSHPGLQTLFAQSRAAFVANVGTLVQPITKNEYNAGAPRPPQLYSHNDQKDLWYLGDTDASGRYGWGGRVMDLIDAGGNPNLPPCISISGSNKFEIGTSVFPYQMSTSGVTQLTNYGTSNFGAARRAALDALLAQGQGHLFAGEQGAIFDRSLDLAATLSAALLTSAGTIMTPYDYRGTTPPNPAAGTYPAANLRLSVNGTDYTNDLLDQLRMVARMIKISRTPGAGVDQSRQVYFVRLGGWDTHQDQMDPTWQPLLTARVSQALGWFWQALGEIGAQSEVTVFTMSEFARTLSSNGDGSDHAWGGNQLVLGGQVDGGKVFGRYPALVLNANDDANMDWSFSRGQYIPTTSMDQMAANLAQWLGDGTIDLDAVFPNLANFSGPLDMFL
jgi:uncharacterized protein (DUF1501 family)